MAAYVNFEIGGVARYPTADGRSLEVAGNELRGEISLRFEFRDPGDDLPTDVVACDFRTADRDGRLWQTTSRFTTKLFLVHMYDFSALRHMDLFTTKRADEDWPKPFNAALLLKDARFGTDDRFYRTLLVNGEQWQVQLKYTVLRFDVAAYQPPPELSMLGKLAIRIRSGSFYLEGDPVPAIGYYMSFRHLLLANTAVFDEEDGRWLDAPIPMPLVFEPTEGSGSVQAGVRAVG